MSRRAVMSPSPADATVLAAILASVESLYRAHAEEIVAVREDSDGKAITVNFGVEIDCSKSQPQVDVRIRFSSTVTDKRTNQLDDVNQGSFKTIIAQAEGRDETGEGETGPGDTGTGGEAGPGEGDTGAEAEVKPKKGKSKGKKGKKKKGNAEDEALAQAAGEDGPDPDND